MADLFAKVNCTYCQEEININGVRVQCCECIDFDICLQCFSCGVEIGPHKNDHSYKFVDHCTVSIFGDSGSWTGGEELQLLDAMEFMGFGNWESISKHVQTRSPKEVKEEYVARYVDGNIGKATWAEVVHLRPVLNDHIPEDNGPLAPTITSRLPPLDATSEEARQLGYMPHRDDYEREYDMAAEQLVSSLQLNIIEDSNIEVALKLAQVDMYTRRLRERARRKRVVRDYQLVAKFFSNQRKEISKRPLSKEQKEFREKMRVFSQFLTAGEHQRLISNIERERELRHRLSELLRYRSLGLTTQEEIIHYEQHVAYQRQQQIRQNRAGSSGYAISVPEHQLKKGKNEEDQNFTEGKFTWLQDGGPENNSCNNNSSIDTLIPSSLSNSLPLGSLLSQHEIQLCTFLKMNPVQYTTLKSLIIQDSMLPNSKIKLTELDNISNEVSSKDAVIQYLAVSGWLPSVPIN